MNAEQRTDLGHNIIRRQRAPDALGSAILSPTMNKISAHPRKRKIRRDGEAHDDKVWTLSPRSLDTSSLTEPDPNPTTGDMDLTSLSSFGEKEDLKCRPGHVPKFKIWLKPKLVVGIVEFVGRLIGLITAPVDVEMN